MSVRVRIPPSPTGPFHVGTARTALFNYLFARQHGGRFILRLEDTDRERSKSEYEKEILEALQWLGLQWDEGPGAQESHAPYRQSERMGLYQEPIERLLREGKASIEEGAVMFHTRVDAPVVVHDLIRGEVTFPVKELEDFVIAKPAQATGSRQEAVGKPAPRSPKGEVGWSALYHLAVVLDDEAMGITHVIRGEDHLSNTPRQLLLQQALGFQTPQYAHVPLLLDPERKKLSKRALGGGQQLDVRLLAYRDAGYLPEAMLNFLALMGWNPKTTDEVFSLRELVERFRLEDVQKGGAIFDVKKLDWLQRQHLQHLQPAQILERIPDPFLAAQPERGLRGVEVWRERGGPLVGAPEALKPFFVDPRLNLSEMVPGTNLTVGASGASVAFASAVFARMPDTAWEDRQTLQERLLKEVDGAGKNRSEVLWPARYALSGLRNSPGPADFAWVLGKEETLRRLQKAIDMIGGGKNQ